MRKTMTFRRARTRELVSIYAMVGVPYLLFATFVLFPLLWILRYSFYDYDGVRATFVGLENFRVLIADKVWWKSVVNTLILTFGSLAIGMPLSLLFAVILNGKLKGRVAFRAILYFPVLISLAVVGIIFRIMLAPDNGIINELLIAAGLIDKPIYVLATAGAALLTLILVEVWHGMGYNMTLMLAGLQRIPAELYEAAIIDGANERQKMFYVTIPQLGPMLQIIIMLHVLNGLKIFDLVNVLTRGQPFHGSETIVTYIFNYFFEMEGYRAQQGYAASASVVAFLIISIVALTYFKLSRRLSNNE
ncbi:sugar ABC transporter permease [Cohnella sp. LGH]|uniref:carbohydrate ABC transporter permease n=1 Tax=Cohnella sp. LGH TaxID=1619153 RepID=UPI001ADA9737|nr:sugar ABC transporter permease [Cohnella sp. LGH]QTH45373.1 sugar ABC transporter permease [Cohnella sp. LGH]